MDEHETPTMRIAVGPAGKVGDGVNAYYVYTVTSEPIVTAATDKPATVAETEPTAEKSKEAAVHVDRRYSDFLWLHNQVRTHDDLPLDLLHCTERQTD